MSITLPSFTLPLIMRLTSRLAAPSATISRTIGTVVLRYRF
jgi:hypothetical protein